MAHFESLLLQPFLADFAILGPTCLKNKIFDRGGREEMHQRPQKIQIEPVPRGSFPCRFFPELGIVE